MKRKLTALIALTSTACSTWQVQSGAPGAVTQENADHEPLRFDLYSGKAVDVYAPRVIGDSVFGLRHRPAAYDSATLAKDRVALAMSDIRGVAVRKFATGRTILAVAAIAVTTAAIAGASSGGSNSNTSCASTPPASTH